jgi:hypothetical protein
MNMHLCRGGLLEGIQIDIRDKIMSNKMYVWEVGTWYLSTCAAGVNPSSSIKPIKVSHLTIYFWRSRRTEYFHFICELWELLSVVCRVIGGALRVVTNMLKTGS